jgi:pimeloyl-ACP methyl ester carboxylesterase
MRRNLSPPSRIPIFLLVLLFPALAQAQLDDRQITIHTSGDVARARGALVAFVWGGAGIPSGRLPAITRDVPSPLDGLHNLRRVDELRTDMDGGEQGFAYHFVPREANGRLVIVHNGHTCSLEGFGIRETIDALLAARYGVLAVYMPHLRPGDCRPPNHDFLFTDARYASAAGSPLRYFLEPVAVSLNYLRMKPRVDHFPLYREVNMVGLSGGGWVTTVYAAIDPRIRHSVSVAGSIPLASRAGSSVGDLEQTLEDFYRVAGYPDLYLLGSRETHREQLWILNRNDDCCFGARFDLFRDPAGRPWEEVMRGHESDVRLALRGLAPAGDFRLVIDETATSHMISPFALDQILAALDGGRRGSFRAPAARATMGK